MILNFRMIRGMVLIFLLRFVMDSEKTSQLFGDILDIYYECWKHRMENSKRNDTR